MTKCRNCSSDQVKPSYPWASVFLASMVGENERSANIVS